MSTNKLNRFQQVRQFSGRWPLCSAFNSSKDYKYKIRASFHVHLLRFSCGCHRHRRKLSDCLLLPLLQLGVQLPSPHKVRSACGQKDTAPGCIARANSGQTQRPGHQPAECQKYSTFRPLSRRPLRRVFACACARARTCARESARNRRCI